MLKSQKNKREFIKPFAGMINKNGENGLVHISKACIVELEQNNKIKKLQTPNNNWYKVNYSCSTKINLLEAEPDYYKVVNGGEIGEFLRHYKWCYDGKNVYGCSIIMGKKVMIERIILNYQKYGYFKNAELEKETHHMWFRFCALAGTLKSMDKVVHLQNHQKIGNYNRGQSIEILTASDFDYFISVVDEAYNVLQHKIFSMEF